MSLPLVLTPLKHRQFAWLCAGTMIAALGTWIQSTTSAWIMTDLAPDALMVSLTQAAAQLPILFLVVPAGALADLVDRRRYLVLTNVWMFAMAALLAVLYGLGLVGPWLLLALTALLSVGVALNAPAWSSSVPLTVPRDDLPRAVLLNSMGFNLARAIGPALGGILVATIGAAFAFTLNAASFALVAVISGAILAFPAARPLGGLPPESKGRAILLGLRYVGAEPNVRAAMVRSLAFYGLASAIWALLPIFVRQKLGMSAAGYGVMLGATGVGAMLGGIMMPWLNGRLSRDNQVMLGGVVCSATLLPVALLSSTVATGCAMIVFGCGWILAASNLLATVQLASAPWVRARCVAVYQAIFNGGMGFGAITWGWLAESAGLSGTLLAAGLGGIGMALVSRAYPLSEEIIDPSLPSSVTPPVVIAHDMMLSDLKASRHSVAVTIAYEVNYEDADAFRAAMSDVAAARRRDGATAWTLGRDIERPGRWLEAFRIPDWWELHRGIARMNLTDGEATRTARTFHRDEQPPDVSVMVIEQLDSHR